MLIDGNDCVFTLLPIPLSGYDEGRIQELAANEAYFHVNVPTALSTVYAECLGGEFYSRITSESVCHGV